MENQISIEEIKAAVLAECDANKNRLVGKFPNCILVSPCATFDPINGSHTRHDLLAVGIDGGGEFTIVSIRPNSSFGEIVVAYRLLGLESKAKDAEIDGLLGMVKREQEIADEYLGRLKVEREKIAWLRAGIGAVLKLRGSAFSFEKTYGFSMLSYLLTGEEYKDQCKRLVEDELENGGQS